MAKDASMFSSLSGAPEENIYVIHDYALTFTGNGDVDCHHYFISNVYNVPILSANLMSISQLKKTKKNTEFWLD